MQTGQHGPQDDEGWVCETHPDQPAFGPHACSCGGAGMPCRNSADIGGLTPISQCTELIPAVFKRMLVPDPVGEPGKTGGSHANRAVLASVLDNGQYRHRRGVDRGGVLLVASHAFQ